MFNNPYIMYPYPQIFNGINTARGIRNINLFSRIKNGIKTINWTGLINNTSKTLGIINQTIPMVKQVGPVMNNMKSMLKLASVFKDETDKPKPINTNRNISNNNNTKASTPTNNNQKDYSPTFFIPS